MDQPSSTESSAITLRIKFKSASLDDFINRYGVDVSPGGIFIRTKQPIEVGTTLKFEFSLADGSPLLTGTGTVAWVRENDPGRPNNVPGMGLRFDKLVPESQHAHQAILAEKARKEGKEGKAPGTPSPATSSVVPATKPSLEPEIDRTDTAKLEDGNLDAVPVAVSLATTRPAPAALMNPSALPFALPPSPDTAPPSQGDQGERVERGERGQRGERGERGEVDEFDGEKTELSARPFDYYFKDAARQAGEVVGDPLGKTAEEAIPNKLIDDLNTDSALLLTKSAPRPTGSFQEAAEAPLAVDSPTAKPLSGERKSGGFASLLELGNSEERAPTANGASSEYLDEVSAGAPIEEAVPERTEEVAAGPVAAPAATAALAEAAKFAAPEPFDLGSPSLENRPPSQDGMPSVRPKGAGKKVAIIAALAAVAAFAAVYLAKARPWERAPASPTAAFPKPAPSSPAPVPPLMAEPSKPAAEEPAKPVPAAEGKVEPEKKTTDSADKVAEKANERANDEKPAAKSEPEASSKPTSKSKAAKASAAEKATAADEEIYRLVFRSSPLSAEVLIDGEYYARTPCERRILDPNKAYAITVRKQGYESHERLLGPSDNWVKKGNERLLTVSVTLKKASVADSAKPAGSTTEAKAAKALDPAKAEDTKPVLKAEPAKAVSPPEEKPALFKPSPNFDEPAPKKAKE
jgi:uncharacterized protein (TIGR02266 family)